MNRRQAPPPPPPSQRRRTQPEFIKELAVTAEKKATLRHRGKSLDHESQLTTESHDLEVAPPISGEAATILEEEQKEEEEQVDVVESEQPSEPQDGITLKSNTSMSRLKPRSHPAPPPKATPTVNILSEEGSETKSHTPPPVASKPKKKKVKKKAKPVGQDEPDLGVPQDVSDHAGEGDVPPDKLDELVLEASGSSEVVGVKGRVKEQADKQDKELITEALKRQAEDGSKFGK